VYTANANLVAAGVTWRSQVVRSFNVRSGGEVRVRERMDCSSRVCREGPKSCNSWASRCEGVRSGGVGVGSRRPRGGGRQRVLGGRGAGSRGDRSDPSMGRRREYRGGRGVDGPSGCCIVFGV